MATQVDSLATGRGAGERDRTRPAAYLVRLIDCTRPLVPSSRHLLRDVDVARVGRGADGARRLRDDDGRVLALSEDNPRISSAHARIRRVLDRWLLEDLGSKNGILVNGARVQGAALADGDLVEIGRTFYLFRQGVEVDEDAALDVAAPADDGPGTLSPALGRDLETLATVARSELSVVLHGETGTGKEVIARAVHAQSGRRGPFVAVNCGAIPETLVESELFGVRRGAFSDAREDRPGLIRSAHKGTLFLDEIGDLKLGIQAAFLRALQEREVVPVGQAQGVPVDVRVISASHRDLEELARTGKFREDLLARLAGFTMELPPLRARREDLGILVAALVRRFSDTPAKVTFHPDAMRLLLGHGWPRNIRELEKRLQRALVIAGTGSVEVAHVGELAPGDEEPPATPPAAAEDDPRRAELERLLAEHGGNLAAVARVLGKDRVQIRRWLQRYGLDPEAHRAAGRGRKPEG